MGAEARTQEISTYRIPGLSAGNSGVGEAEIDFGITRPTPGGLNVIENGVNRGNFGAYR